MVLAGARGWWCGVGFPAFGGRLVLWLFSGGSRSGVRAGRSCHRRPPPVIQGSWRLLFAGPHCWVCVQRRQTERERDPPERKKKERKKERKKSAGDRRRGPRTGRFELRTKVVPMSACHGGAHGQGTSNSRPVCGLPLVGGRSRVRGGREVTCFCTTDELKQPVRGERTFGSGCPDRWSCYVFERCNSAS